MNIHIQCAKKVFGMKYVSSKHDFLPRYASNQKSHLARFVRSILTHVIQIKKLDSIIL